MHFLSLGVTGSCQSLGWRGLLIFDKGGICPSTELALSKPNVRFVLVKTVSSPLIFPVSSDTTTQPESVQVDSTSPPETPSLTDTMILCRFWDFFFLNCPPCSPHCPFSWILLLSRGVPNGKFNWHWEGGRKDSPGRTNRSLQESPALVVQQNLNQWACYQLWANCPFPVFSKCAHPECKTGFGFRSL